VLHVDKDVPDGYRSVFLEEQQQNVSVLQAKVALVDPQYFMFR
jgi:hypothetical protein